ALAISSIFTTSNLSTLATTFLLATIYILKGNQLPFPLTKESFSIPINLSRGLIESLDFLFIYFNISIYTFYVYSIFIIFN
ncbi:MAG: hypothetical protein RR591_01500, partial [Cetobacterium sp.]